MAGTNNSTNSKLLVEVGCGESPRPGYVHCDIYPAKCVEYVCNAWAIPFKRESVDEIYVRHMLEHLTYREARRTLKHWLAVLKVDGRIDINVPDLERHIEQLTKDGYSPYLNEKVTNREHAMAGIYGWQRDDRDVHKWAYTFETLSELLSEIGYGNIRRVKDNSLSAPVNLRVTAEKNRLYPNLRRDPESLRPMWVYYNWRELMRSSADRLKLQKLILLIRRVIRSIRGLCEQDYTGKGERQASTTLNGIRQDHVERYRFASKHINKNDVVLDCACGVGYGSFILAKETHLSSVVAVDRDKRAMRFARKYYRDDRLAYRRGDIFSLDIPDNYFDCIVSFETIEHVDGSALTKLYYEKLKRGGRLIVSTPNQDTQPFTKQQFPFHLRHYTPSEFKTLLTSNGFEILGRYTQHDREKGKVTEGWDGLFNIAIARKR